MLEEFFTLLDFGHILFELILLLCEEFFGFVNQSDAGFEIADALDFGHLLQKGFDLFKIFFDDRNFKIFKPLLLQRASPLSMSQEVL